MQSIHLDGRPQRLPFRTSVWLQQGRSLAHAGLVIGLSLFIMFGPAAGQIFGRHHGFLREWIMFSGSGIGVLKGRFTLHSAGGSDQTMTPLALMRLTTYPDAPPDEFGRLVFHAGDLRKVAAQVCNGRAAVSRLSFAGWVGTRQGWRSLAVDDVCALPEHPAGDGSSDEEPVF